MAVFSGVEKTTRDITIAHMGVMFAYKLFSLYFPLFLVLRGFSLPEVGYAYLLIYLSFAIFSPIVGFLNHKINSALLASVGISGYGIYSLGMISIHSPVLFYFFQVFLGISAALFFVSMRTILISSPIKNHTSSFGWFYSAPFYANALAPAVGALVIWKFGFSGVFVLSLVLQFMLAIFFFARFKNQKIDSLDKTFNLVKMCRAYIGVFNKLKSSQSLSIIVLSLTILIFDGFYHAFFPLFLKSLGWSQNYILFFISIFSLLILPVSFLIIKKFSKNGHKNERAIIAGGLITAVFSVSIGVLTGFLNFFIILLLFLGKSIGVYITDTARSGFIAEKLKENSEEAGVVDSVFSPLGTAVGSLASGLLIGSLGFSTMFILGGVVV